MSIFLLIAFTLAGLILLGAGADRMVIGSCAIARRNRLSESVIGATIVAGGTSLPELIASMQAASDGHFGLAIGNVIGSNICNIALGIGLVAIIVPMAIARSISQFDWLLMAAVSVGLTIVVISFDQIPIAIAVLFLIAWVTYVIISINRGNGSEQAELHPSPPMQTWLAVTWVVLGLLLLISGGWLLVKGAVGIAEILGISDVVIGLTVVAIGTSAPEIANSIIATIRGRHQLAIGNIIGSNTFNILLILGLVGLNGDVRIEPEIRSRDIWWLLLFALSLPIIWGFSHRVIGRIGGIILLTMFLCYSMTLYYQSRG